MTDGDPYQNLVIAIVHRAKEDAQGHCAYSAVPDQAQADARAWLRDPTQGARLLELAGFDSERVLRQIRQAVGL